MDKGTDKINENLQRYYETIKDIYPIHKMILFGSFAKGTASKNSDIDVGVVVDIRDHSQRINISKQLFHYASLVDCNIEPKCIFRDEYQKHSKASILAEIIRTGKVIFSND